MRVILESDVIEDFITKELSNPAVLHPGYNSPELDTINIAEGIFSLRSVNKDITDMSFNDMLGVLNDVSLATSCSVLVKTNPTLFDNSFGRISLVEVSSDDSIVFTLKK